MLNLIRSHVNRNIKNCVEEEYDVPQNLDLLNKWTIPKIDPKTIYKFGVFDNISLRQVVHTTEETMPLNKEDMCIKLLTPRSLGKYVDKDNVNNFIHIGLVQIAFKPLTLDGLPESFIAALRDARNLDYNSSLMGIIQTSLAHGPVYFNVYPNLQLSLTDKNIYEALTLNVKTHGYKYIPGSEVICVCSRVYYKPLQTLNPRCQIKDKSINETVLIETNFNRSEITTRRAIKWEEIDYPENWMIESAVPRAPQTDNNPVSIIQSLDGDVRIQFDSNRRLLKDKSNRSFISPRYRVESPESSRASTSRINDFLKEIPEPSRASMSRMEDNRVEGIKVRPDNIARGVYRVDPDATASNFNFSDE